MSSPSTSIRALLEALAAGRLGVADVEEQLHRLQIAEMGFAALDLDREARRGLPEVVYGEGKTAEQIVLIARRLADAGQNVLVTRVDAERRAALRAGLPEFEIRESDLARLLEVRVGPVQPRGGPVAVLAAGTSDLPVAEEAAFTAEWHGCTVERAYDVGVAGLHRLLGRADLLRRARVIIAVAGMEGALPTVVSGLVRCPVIAVPTSVGYGVSQGGFAALLTMLSSCSTGVAVVNIDNGFGAGCMAGAILGVHQEPAAAE
jgi:NCAIR mutase (PurE)-related protein